MSPSPYSPTPPLPQVCFSSVFLFSLLLDTPSLHLRQFLWHTNPVAMVTRRELDRRAPCNQWLLLISLIVSHLQHSSCSSSSSLPSSPVQISASVQDFGSAQVKKTPKNLDSSKNISLFSLFDWIQAYFGFLGLPWPIYLFSCPGQRNR